MELADARPLSTASSWRTSARRLSVRLAQPLSAVVAVPVALCWSETHPVNARSVATAATRATFFDLAMERPQPLQPRAYNGCAPAQAGVDRALPPRILPDHHGA